MRERLKTTNVVPESIFVVPELVEGPFENLKDHKFLVRLNILQFFLANGVNTIAFENLFGLLHVCAAKNHTGGVGFAAGKAVHVFDVAAVFGKKLKDFV